MLKQNCVYFHLISAQEVICYKTEAFIELASTKFGLVCRRLLSANRQRPLSLTKTNILQNLQLTNDKNPLPCSATAK